MTRPSEFYVIWEEWVPRHRTPRPYWWPCESLAEARREAERLKHGLFPTRVIAIARVVEEVGET